jgi:tetratricopeptide (TPR) repeat protein
MEHDLPHAEPFTTDEALAAALRTLADCEQRAAAPAWRAEALAEVGRRYRAHGALPVAERYLRSALNWAEALPSVDARIDLLCELADVRAERSTAAKERGDRARARLHREMASDLAHEAVALTARASDASWEVQVLLRASDALDRTGDHDEAIALQCRALHLLMRGEMKAQGAEAAFAATGFL